MENEFDFSGSFIGIVYSSNTKTREVSVFVPKLMPMIPEGRENVTTKTNVGSISSEYTPIYNENIVMSSVIVAKAEDYTAPIPKNGSRVLIEFLEGNPLYPYWSEWNYNGDYEIIDEEKYPEYFQLVIGEHRISVLKDDIVTIELPYGYDAINLSEGKNKKFSINITNNIYERLADIEDNIGNPTINRLSTDKSGNQVVETVEPSGIYELIEKLREEIDELKKKIIDLESN